MFQANRFILFIAKMLPSKLDRFLILIEVIRSLLRFVLSESRWALYRETISVNDLYYLVYVNKVG